MTGADGVITHKVDPEHFRALAAGGGDGSVVAPLRKTERSWRLTALLALLDSSATIEDIAGPLPAIETAWELLSQAYAGDPAAVEEVLAQPQVGLWAAYTVRRIVHHSGAEPLWPEVGYLHCLAVASAVRAGLSGELTVPVVHRTVSLPTVGTAEFPAEVTHVRATFDGKTLTLSDGAVTVQAQPDDPRWHEPVRFEASAGGQDLRVTVLDRDAYRNLRNPVPPRPLGPDDVERWRGLLAGAWRLLVSEQPERAAGIAACLRTLTPEPRRTAYRPRSASGAEAFGGVLLSEPDDVTQLAVTLIHEGQHQKLGALLHMLTLVRSGPDVRYYAPWRDDPRPLDGLLQGVYAFAGITDFWRVRRLRALPGEVPLAQFEFALWRHQVSGAVQVLAGSGRLTDLGRRFVGGLTETMASWPDEPVPAEIRQVAEDMALDHHAQWRASCMPVDEQVTSALTTAFRRGDPVPAAAIEESAQTVVALPAVGWLDGRAVLVRHRLAGQTDLAAVRVEGSTPSDRELVSGRSTPARLGYLRDLERDPRDVPALIGLGLALDRTDPAARALLGRPELLLAMAGDRIDPLAAARWLGDGPAVITPGAPRPAGWRVA